MDNQKLLSVIYILTNNKDKMKKEDALASEQIISAAIDILKARVEEERKALPSQLGE